MFEVLFTAKALRFLEKLARQDSSRIYKKLESIKANPSAFLQRLSSLNLWKLRIGDYRAIIRLDAARSELVVVDIGHRSNVYKNL